MPLTVILPIFLAVIASLSAYLVARRQTSGSIGSSTAERLWEVIEALDFDKGEVRRHLEENAPSHAPRLS